MSHLCTDFDAVSLVYRNKRPTGLAVRRIRIPRSVKFQHFRFYVLVFPLFRFLVSVFLVSVFTFRCFRFSVFSVSVFPFLCLGFSVSVFPFPFFSFTCLRFGFSVFFRFRVSVFSVSVFPFPFPLNYNHSLTTRPYRVARRYLSSRLPVMFQYRGHTSLTQLP